MYLPVGCRYRPVHTPVHQVGTCTLPYHHPPEHLCRRQSVLQCWWGTRRCTNDQTARPRQKMEHAQIIVMLDDRRDEMGWMDDEARRPVNDATLHTQRYMSLTCTSDPTVSQAKQQRTAVLSCMTHAREGLPERT